MTDGSKKAAAQSPDAPGRRKQIKSFGRSALASDGRHLAEAYRLKDACVEAWSSDPSQTFVAAAALDRLRAEVPHCLEIQALSSWAHGIVDLVEGRMEAAVGNLDDAYALLSSLDKAHTAASTQVVKLYALAMLGRYEEAVKCGLRAREVFLTHEDILSAGKVEHNIGNIFRRRDRYAEAERFQLSARERFAALQDEKQLAKIDNCLANIHALQHRFRSAEELYDQAFRRAEESGLAVTQAEIEASMGNLALFQGRFERALDYLERSRRRYAHLGMPHKSAIAEQEIADAYLELNLIPEANTIYERVIPTFVQLGMSAEEAQARANQARALMQLGQYEKASHFLCMARRLYRAEGNAVGEATVLLTEAQLHYLDGKYPAAKDAAEKAEGPLAAAGSWRRILVSRWLNGEATRAMGDLQIARDLLAGTAREAQKQSQPQIEHLCHTSLGQIGLQKGEVAAAEESFKRAIDLIENLRAPLPAEEFRTAFFADKLAPYEGMVQICLDSPAEDRTREAFQHTERARSRALLDVLGRHRRGGGGKNAEARDAFEAALLSRLDELRDELNWFYAKINHAEKADGKTSAPQTAALQQGVREREGAVADIMRQLHHRGSPALTHFFDAPLDLEELQGLLGEETVLVEYTALGGELLAFVVTGHGVEVVRELGEMGRAVELINQLKFQIDALRYGAERVRRHLPQLTQRTINYLRPLYDLLVRPLASLLGEKRVVIVPHRELHYAPFHALHDGENFLIEKREISLAPSASVLNHCLSRPQLERDRALLLGISDERAPYIRGELADLSKIFPRADLFLEECATLAALEQNAPTADVIHLACHGQFRPDNPLFSSLRLADGWLTVGDTAKLDLNCSLITLSACETGMSSVTPGDELIGLARGFLSAGAPSLLLSLWNVDDESTSRLMSDFYRFFRAGCGLAEALRKAQMALIKVNPHPFFWSPFVLFGRW